MLKYGRNSRSSKTSDCPMIEIELLMSFEESLKIFAAWFHNSTAFSKKIPDFYCNVK